MACFATLWLGITEMASRACNTSRPARNESLSPGTSTLHVGLEEPQAAMDLENDGSRGVLQTIGA